MSDTELPRGPATSQEIAAFNEYMKRKRKLRETVDKQNNDISKK
jgi:hypothetical protein